MTGPPRTARHHRLVRVAAVVLATAGLGAGAGLGLGAVRAAPAAADPMASCSTTTGVVVAVDLAPFGGEIERGCDATVTNGVDALEHAGFTLTGVAAYGLDFVCQIDGFPADETCQSTPPADASWSFWYAPAGVNDWTYSQIGVEQYAPTAGSVVAWTFQTTDQVVPPPFSPRKVRAKNPTTVPTTTTTSTPGPPVSTTGGGAGAAGTTKARGDQHGAPAVAGSTGGPPSGAAGSTGGPSTGAADGTTTTAAPASATTSSTAAPEALGSTPTADPTTSPHPAGTKIAEAQPASALRPGATGSPWGLALAGGLAIVLAAGAGLLTWRRRRSGAR